MTTTPNSPNTEDNADSASSPRDDHAPSGETPGAEIGISDGEGSSFEPEEDPEP
jgi:hypothetical protein